MLRTHKSQGGQMLLMVILVMVVSLTVGLSLVSRTITNIKIAEQNERSQSAFQAAEAGINLGSKQTIANTGKLQGSFTGGGKFQTEVKEAKANELLLNSGDAVEQDVGVDIWLSDYTPSSPFTSGRTSGTLTFYFATGLMDCAILTGSDVMPAIEVIALSAPSGYTVSNPKLDKWVIDPCSRIAGSDSVTGAGSTIGGVIFVRSKPIFYTEGMIARVIPLYNSTQVAVNFTPSGVSPDLSLQGRIIESEGQSGETVRKLVYYESLPQFPGELFQYSIMGQNN